MVKFVALYRMPADPETFAKRYHEDHLPLVRQFPHLQRLEVSRVTWPREDAPYHLMAELWYEDREKMKESLKSEVSQQAAAVLADIAGQDEVTMFHFEVMEE